MLASDDVRKRMHHEHRTLRVLQEDMLDRFETFCSEPGVQSHGAMVEVFRDFRASLERHFDFEEEGGYLRAVTTRRPHHQDQVDALRAEHDTIRDIMARLSAELDADLTGDLPRCETFKNDFVELMRQFGRHEQAESELVMEVFWLEGGVSD